MLGDDVWKTTQNEMIKILSQHEPNEIVFSLQMMIWKIFTVL